MADTSRRHPSTASREGAYFLKNVEGITRARVTTDEKVAAVTYIARQRVDGEDFQLLTDALGLGDTVNALREQRRSA